MEEFFVVGQLLQTEGGKEGEDGRHGKNREKDCKEERIAVLARAEPVFEAVSCFIIAELKAIRPVVDGGTINAKGSECVSWRTKYEDGSLL